MLYQIVDLFICIPSLVGNFLASASHGLLNHADHLAAQFSDHTVVARGCLDPLHVAQRVAGGVVTLHSPFKAMPYMPVSGDEELKFLMGLVNYVI